MSQDQRPLYRFTPTSKVELMTARGKVFLFDTPDGGERASLRENEYDLANLFNGRRSEEEIRDIVQKAKGLALSADDLRDFIVKLTTLGLLEAMTPAPARAAPRRRLALAKAQQVPAYADGELAEDEAVVEELADGPPAGRAARRRAAPGRHRPGRAAWQADALADDPLEVEDAEFGGFDDGDHAPDPGDDGPPRTPEEMLDEAFAAARPASGRQAEAKPKRARLLFRLPVAWLLPLAAPLGWAGRGGFAALLLVGLLGAAVFGLWMARGELSRDLDRWLVPVTIAQSLALALITVNLWAQLARAAEYRRQLGEAPPFGIGLAWNVLPVFFADLSGLAKARDIGAARAVFAASLSAIGTICLVMYAGWLMTKNNGTTLPLLFVGIALLASIRLLLSLNPLGRRDGYYLMALSLGIPDLRQRALGTLLGRTLPPLPPSARAYPSPWMLSIYGLAIGAYVIALLVLATLFVGGWLESHWGGFGVVLYVTLVGLVFWRPLRETLGRSAQPRSRAVQRYRKRTLGQRLWSMAKLTLALSVLVAIGLIPYRYEPGGDFVLRPLQTNRTDVRSVISGRVDQLLVQEGDRVEVNQLLARLSADEETKNVASTEANIRELEAQLSKARAGATPETIAVARQKVSTAKTRHQYSQSKAERWAQLHSNGFVSAQDYENVRGEADTHREQLLQAEKELAELLAGTRKEEIEQLRAAIDEQQANLDYYRQQQRNAEIRAPIAGYVVSGSLIAAAGNYLKHGDLLLTIEDASELVAEIEVPQFDIGFARIGAPIRLKTWTLPDLEIAGEVLKIAPSASETEGGKMVRVTSAIDNSAGLLKSGMTGYAKIESEEMPVALAFTRWVVRFLKIELWSWLP